MAKKKVYKSSIDFGNVYDETCHMLNNKYYNIFRSNFYTEGLDYRQKKYVMDKFWNFGSVASFRIKNSDEIGFAKWNRITWDMYGEPETINLVNTYGSPLIPNGELVVDEDVVIIYIQSNRKPVKLIVDWYVKRIAQVECIINTNLQVQKMPFIIPVADENEKAKLEDVVERILNNEIVICVDGVEPQLFKAIATGVPYLVDKLQNYKKDLENDLLTYLGVNNSGSNKVEQLQMAEVNSNNEEINLSDSNFNTELQEGCERVKEVLNIIINIGVSSPDATNDGQEHDNDIKPGAKAKEGEENE